VFGYEERFSIVAACRLAMEREQNLDEAWKVANRFGGMQELAFFAMIFGI